MTSNERMNAVLSHQKPDRVPVYPILSGITRKLVGCTYEQWSTDAKLCSEALLRAAEQYEQDCIVTLVDLSVECDAWGQPIIYPENEAAHPDYSHCVISDIDGYADIKKADYTQSKRMMMEIETCRLTVEGVHGEKPVIAFVFGPLGVLSMLRGQQELYMDLYDDADAVHSALDAITETLCDYCRAIMKTGVAGIMIDTLFASGSIMSKKMWRETEGPYAARVADAIRDAGGLVMIHNCGEKIYFDAQIESMKPCAISFLYPPDDCADLAECKAKYGDKITLIGCVPPVMAVTGSDEEWDERCRQNIAALGSDGGFILASGCEYPANADFSRARRMTDIAKEWKY
ncbi:MAG: uroporphyrinogen decarboxylase family protein [Eubacteriales bacterium]